MSAAALLADAQARSAAAKANHTAFMAEREQKLAADARAAHLSREHGISYRDALAVAHAEAAEQAEGSSPASSAVPQGRSALAPNAEAESLAKGIVALYRANAPLNANKPAGRTASSPSEPRAVDDAASQIVALYRGNAL